MHFDERVVGDYRIFAGAMEAPRGDGYTAAMIVQRLRGIPNAPREAYRDESLAGGHRWESAEAALAYAFHKAQEVIRKQAVGALAA
ncbi:MAG: hypothetical protein JSR59_16240 [Proteobacteria bacterium]|nr:hypothetical protein [Pseudomonadota bacterium]